MEYEYHLWTTLFFRSLGRPSNVPNRILLAESTSSNPHPQQRKLVPLTKLTSFSEAIQKMEPIEITLVVVLSHCVPHHHQNAATYYLLLTNSFAFVSGAHMDKASSN